MLATLKEPPPTGSLRESLLIALWLQKEQMDFMQTFAIVQAMADKSKIKDAFDEYRKTRFPWIESSKNKQKSDDIKRLMEEVGRGALAISPIISPKLSSRMKTKIIQRQQPGNPQVTQEQKKIYDKIGQIIPR